MIYLITGNHFMVQRSYRKLRKRILGDSKECDLLEGKEVAASRLIEMGRSLPLLGGKQLVVVHGADKIRKGECETLLPHLETIVKSSEVIFLADKVDARTKFWQKVKKVGKFRNFRPLYSNEVPAWIRDECRERQVGIDFPALDWLTQRFGSEIGLISGALDKTVLLLKKGDKISVELLEATVSSFAWKNLFELTEAIGSKKTDRVFRLFRQMLLSGESPVALLALVAHHFRTLTKVKETGEGASPYFLRNYQAQAAGFSFEKLYQANEKIFKTDWELKSSPIPQRMLMEKLLLQLVR